MTDPNQKRVNPQSYVVRRSLTSEDREPIETLLKATGFFNAEELEVAMELVDDRLKLGDDSHYRFLVLEENGQVLGYGCWGPIPGSVHSVDLYWAAVHPKQQNRGVGRAIVEAAEAWIGETGRRRIYIETSTRPQYVPTRAFYLRCGYQLAAELVDFYAPGDGKAIYVKVLSDSAGPHGPAK